MSRPSPCPDCGARRVVTRDAIGRPRDRCPECQGIGLAGAAQPAVYVNQRALSSADVRAFPKGTCQTCGGRLERRPGPGRPPKHCEAHLPENTRFYRRHRARQREMATTSTTHPTTNRSTE